MKDFEYYSEPMRKVVSLSTVKQRLYEHVGFNPDNFDSKKQEQEVRRQLDEQAKEIHEALIDDANSAEQQFKEDLFEELEIQDNPKRELLYQKAYEMGHSYGFSEIYCYACELVELIK